MKFFLILLLISQFVFASFKVVDRFQAEVSIDRKGIPAIFYINPPVYIYEGINNEIIIPQETFFEVFDKKGRLIKKVGNRGNGPGDFNGIMSLIIFDNRYYFHDYPNVISAFDVNFSFINRTIFGGPGISQFMQSFDIFNGKLYCSQNYRKEIKAYDSISVYSLAGKNISHFFDQKNGWKIYPFLSLVAGKLKVVGSNIYFVYFPTPKIYKLSLTGSIIKSVEFGKDWWEKIKYEEKAFKKQERKVGDKAYAELLLSGDRIMKLMSWKNNLLVHIIKNPAEDYLKHGIIILSLDLEKRSKFISYKDYHFSGAGKFVYFSKELEEYDNKDKYKVEILKCDIGF